MIRDERQIDKHVVRLIRNKYSIDTEQKLSRILHGMALGTYTPLPGEMEQVAEYQIYVEGCRETGKQMAIDSEIERRELEYSQAVNRLKKYKLEDGRPEQVIEPVLDEFDNVIEEGYTIPGIDPIEPLMMTRTLYDDEGNETGTEEYLNPVIERDRSERLASEQIVEDYENA